MVIPGPSCIPHGCPWGILGDPKSIPGGSLGNPSGTPKSIPGVSWDFPKLSWVIPQGRPQGYPKCIPRVYQGHPVGIAELPKVITGGPQESPGSSPMGSPGIAGESQGPQVLLAPRHSCSMRCRLGSSISGVRNAIKELGSVGIPFDLVGFYILPLISSPLFRWLRNQELSLSISVIISKGIRIDRLM